MKNKIIPIILLSVITLTGCHSSNDFLGKTASDYNSGMKIYEISQNLLTDTLEWEGTPFPGIYNWKTEINKMAQALNKSEYKDYTTNMTDEKGYLQIDLSNYAQKIILDNGYKIVESDMVDKSEIYYENHSYKVIDNVIFITDSDKNVDLNEAFVMISKDETLSKTLQECGFPGLYEAMTCFDDYNYNIAVNNEHTDLLSNYADGYCGSVYNDGIFIEMHIEEAYIESNAVYLSNLYGNDAWKVYNSATNEACDSISFLNNQSIIDNNGKYSSISNSLILYGKNNELKEIMLSLSDMSEKLTDCNKTTVINCLKELGCSKEEAVSITDDLPMKNGKIGNVEYRYDKKTNSIKFYSVE